MSLETKIKSLAEHIASEMKTVRDNSWWWSWLQKVDVYSNLPTWTDWLLVQVLNDEWEFKKWLYWFYNSKWNLLHEWPEEPTYLMYLDVFDYHNTNWEANTITTSNWTAKLVASPKKWYCAENLKVTSNEFPASWEISNFKKTQLTKEIIMVFYANTSLKFSISITKQNDSEFTLEQFVDANYSEYKYLVYDFEWNEYEWTCNFNFSVNTTRRWSSWDTLSNDDGWWAMSSWNLTFNSPWPYLRGKSDWFWFWNMNSSDSSASTLYLNWSSISWTPKAFIYITE